MFVTMFIGTVGEEREREGGREREREESDRTLTCITKTYWYLKIADPSFQSGGGGWGGPVIRVNPRVTGVAPFTGVAWARARQGSQ